MSGADEDVAGSLIDALAGQGEHVDDGGFTLDPAAAYRKLRAHQLADPQEYLLLLVEAAWLAAMGPKRGQIEITTGRTITVVFSGVALAPGSLRELFAAVLGISSTLEDEALRRGRILRLLGLAANNALALGPRMVRIEASDDSGASERVEISPNGTLTHGVGETLRPKTIRFSVHGSILDRVRARAARQLIARRCRLTQLGVLVDGELVSRESPIELTSAVSVMLDDDEIGLAGQASDSRWSGQTWIINRGVMIQVQSFGGAPGIMTVVEVDLPMDLSRRKFLERPEFHATHRAIRAARKAVPKRQRPPSKGVKENRLRRRPPRDAAKESSPISRAALVRFIVAVVVVGIMLLWVHLAQRRDRAARARALCEAGVVESCTTP
ncbi:MAG: hypothetical protein R6X02_22045 [Enhygromyxa sp.]